MEQKKEERKKIFVDHVNVRVSITFLLLRLLVADFLTTILLVLLYYAVFSTGLRDILPVNDPSWGLIGVIVLTIVESLATVYVVFEWVSEFYEISSYEVVHKRGVFFKKVERYGMQNVKQVVIDQGLLGKLFNYGTLTVFDWRLDKCAQMYAVHNPRRYLRILESLLPNVDEQKNTFGSVEDEDDEEDTVA